MLPGVQTPRGNPCGHHNAIPCVPLYVLLVDSFLLGVLKTKKPRSYAANTQVTLSKLAASRDAVSMYPRVSLRLNRRVLRPALSSSSMSSKFVTARARRDASLPSARTPSCLVVHHPGDKAPNR